MFLETSVNECTIEEVKFLCGIESIRKIWHNMHHNMYGVSWSIPDFCWFLHHLLWRKTDAGFNFFENVLSWIYDRFMWMVYEIFHAMSKKKEGKFCWIIHVATETHGKALNIIARLSSDVHEVTNLVIEGSFMWVFNFFQLFYNKRCIHEEYIFKGYVHWEMWLLELYFIFYLCSSILLNNVFIIWSVWSIMIPYSPWIMLMLRRFIFGTSRKV